MHSFNGVKVSKDLFCGENHYNMISNRMKHPEGYHLDVVSTSADLQQDHMLIRMNVDDFEEAYEILTSHGFKNVNGDKNGGE